MKVLVGCPTSEQYEYCIDEYLKRIREFVFKDFDVLLVDNSKDDCYMKALQQRGVQAIKAGHTEDVRERIAASRNILREQTLKNGYDYFLSLEQDVIPPKDVIPRLLRHQKKIVSGVYYKLFNVTITNTGKSDGIVQKKGKTLMPVLFRFANEPGKMHICTPHEVSGERLLKIRAAGLGCMLIHRGVLEKIHFRKEEGIQGYDDVVFCDDAYSNGFEIYADTSVKCKHLILGKGKVDTAQ